MGVLEFFNGSVVPVLNTQTGTTYTLVAADAGAVVTCNNASAIALTIPPNSGVAFTVNTGIEIQQLGAGQITFTPGAGVTLQSATGSLVSLSQYAVIYLRKIATNVWELEGDLTPRRVIRTVSGTTDTPTAADVGKLVKCTSSSAITVTLANSGFAAGDSFDVVQAGVGVLTFASSDTVYPGVGSLRTQGSAATITYLGSTTWLLNGDFIKGSNRVISSISSPATAAAVIGNDYAYFVSGTTTLTLPTAVGNTSCYTVKNTDASATVSIASTSSQTFDGTASPITIGPGQSIDLLSDNANWRIV